MVSLVDRTKHGEGKKKRVGGLETPHTQLFVCSELNAVFCLWKARIRGAKGESTVVLRRIYRPEIGYLHKFEICILSANILPNREGVFGTGLDTPPNHPGIFCTTVRCGLLCQQKIRHFRVHPTETRTWKIRGELTALGNASRWICIRNQHHQVSVSVGSLNFVLHSVCPKRTRR